MSKIYTLMNILNKIDNNYIFMGTVFYFTVKGWYNGLLTQNKLYYPTFHIIQNTVNGFVDGIFMAFTWPISIPLYLLSNI